MKDLYVLILSVLFPVAMKYILLEEIVDTRIAFGLYGVPNEYTVPIIEVINRYNIPTMLVIKKEELNSYPFALQKFIKQSTHYKFVPYIDNIDDLDAMTMLNTSLVVSPYRFNIIKRTVVAPNYYGPCLKTFTENITLWTKVWEDLRDNSIRGYMLFPYTRATLDMMEEFIHDVKRFEKTINLDWYNI